MYEQTKLKLLGFYICTKEGASTDHSSSEEIDLLEDEENELLEDGSHIDSNDSIIHLQDGSHSSDSDRSTQVCGKIFVTNNDTYKDRCKEFAQRLLFSRGRSCARHGELLRSHYFISIKRLNICGVQLKQLGKTTRREERQRKAQNADVNGRKASKI